MFPHLFTGILRGLKLRLRVRSTWGDFLGAGMGEKEGKCVGTAQQIRRHLPQQQISSPTPTAFCSWRKDVLTRQFSPAAPLDPSVSTAPSKPPLQAVPPPQEQPPCREWPGQEPFGGWCEPGLTWDRPRLIPARLWAPPWLKFHTPAGSWGRDCSLPVWEVPQHPAQHGPDPQLKASVAV